MPTAPVPHCRTKTMRLKKTMAAALAAAMLASAVAVPAFADGSNTMQYYYDEVSGGYKTQAGDGSTQDINGSDANLTTSGQTRVKYEVHSSYSWSIPSEIDFGSDHGYDGDMGKNVYVDTQGGAESNYIKNDDSKVTVTKNVIPYGKKLVITAKGSGTDGAFTIESIGEEVLKRKLNYSVGVLEGSTYEKLNDDNGYEVLEVLSGINDGEALLQFTLNTYAGSNTTAEYADKYAGTVIFTATVEKDI